VHVVRPCSALRCHHKIGRFIALGLLTAIIILAITFGIVELISMLTTRSEGLVALMRKMADAVEVASQQLRPGCWPMSRPTGASSTTIGGAMAARTRARPAAGGHDGGAHPGPHHHRPGDRRHDRVSDLTNRGGRGPLSRVMAERVRLLALRSAGDLRPGADLGAEHGLTAIYLVGVLPLFGVELPRGQDDDRRHLRRRPAAGDRQPDLEPMIVVLSLSCRSTPRSRRWCSYPDPQAGILHQRQDRRHQIEARAWEILIAMLVMEAAFGVPG